ncbi:MAG: efflux RND transporter permease subunit, partial [Acidobacteriota bacterium]
MSSFTTSRPVAVFVMVLAAGVFGYFSLEQLPMALMPELSYPTLTVRTEYPGAAPEEVENDISRPIEEALGVVPGLNRISSISRAGISDVVLEFAWDVDMTDAIQDTLEKLDLVFLPEETEKPLILRFDPSLDPVLELSLSSEDVRFGGEDGLRRLRRIAELQIKRELEPVKGVAAVRVRGGLEEEIHVRIDETQLRRTGLSIQRIIDRLAQENINIAGGTIQEGRTEYLVRTLNEYQDLDQIRETVVAVIDGREVRVGDLAEVATSHREREILTRTEGRESVQIDVYKEADANMVALSKRVQARLGPITPDVWTGAAPPPPERPRWGPPSDDDEPQLRAPAGLAEEIFRTEDALLDIVADRSIFIENSINEVRSTAVFGGLLAVIVLFFFLRNVRSTAIVAVSIPVSLIVTFTPLNLLGVSLNIMSLGGLALGIGMLVDSSIVVLESIFRCKEEGDSLVRAAIRGTREVRGAVIASTLTSIAVFFPMVFVEGVAGQAFGDLGLAVVMSLLASVVVAVVFIPMLASRRPPRLSLDADDRKRGALLRLRAPGRGRDDLRALGRWLRASGALGTVLRLPLALVALPYLLVRTLLQTVFELLGTLLLSVLFALTWLGRRVLLPVVGGVGWLLTALPLRLIAAMLSALQRGYPKLLRTCLRHPLPVVLLAGLVFALTVQIGSQLSSELLPEVHQGEFTVEASLPVGTPLAQTEATLRPVERAILDDPGPIRSLLVTYGYDAANTQRSDEGEHTARFKVLLASSDPAIEDAAAARMRRAFAGVPDVEMRIVRPVLFSFRTPVEVEIHGDDLDALKIQARQVRDRLSALPQLADVESTLRAGAPEVQIVYDRDRLARYDLDVANVAEQVRSAVKGTEATRFNLQDRRIPILVQLQETDRSTVDDVRELVVNPGAERPIRLAAVADVSLGEGPSEVRRIDGRRVALVRANLADDSLGEAVAAIRADLDDMAWPTTMTYFISGQSQEWERSRNSLLLALALSIFLVYVIMAAQFESLLQPLVIMLTIPLAFVGTILALYGLGISLSIVVFLGMIMLAGIVVNNAIVLVDYINTLQARGRSSLEAVIEAGQVRLRPILMTTATTVLGLLPMALGVGDGAEVRTPMAIAVISGLVVSTVLTLVIIPVIYHLVDRFKQRLFGTAPSDAGRSTTTDARPAGRPGPSTSGA